MNILSKKEKVTFSEFGEKVLIEKKCTYNVS